MSTIEAVSKKDILQGFFDSIASRYDSINHVLSWNLDESWRRKSHDLVLDNIEHIQSGWLTEGLKLGQIALGFGCDDMGGTLLEDKVLEPTGIQVQTRPEDLIRLIREAGFTPAQRNTNYEILNVYR